MKIRDGVTKQLLREAMSGILPEATRTRIKKQVGIVQRMLGFPKENRHKRWAI